MNMLLKSDLTQEILPLLHVETVFIDHSFSFHIAYYNGPKQNTVLALLCTHMCIASLSNVVVIWKYFNLCHSGLSDILAHGNVLGDFPWCLVSQK